jgi:hypothetical protein
MINTAAHSANFTAESIGMLARAIFSSRLIDLPRKNAILSLI